MTHFARPNNSTSRVPISVVMAVYNGQRFLARSIESILTQSFADFEFLIIDDGSTDDTALIAGSYESRDSRIKVLHGQHVGLIDSLNRGCSSAQGLYIARFDSDDIAMPDRFQLQLDYFKSHPDVALLGGFTECIDTDDQVLFTMRWPSFAGGLHDYLLLDCYIAHTTVMFRRDLFLLNGGYRHSYQDAEDYDLFLRMSDSYTVDNLPCVLSKYRLHNQQISSIKYAQQIYSGVGARLATRARRSGYKEPDWRSTPVSREDLLRQGISSNRLDDLIRTYSLSQTLYSAGWRWRHMAFCELNSSDPKRRS